MTLKRVLFSTSFLMSGVVSVWADGAPAAAGGPLGGLTNIVPLIVSFGIFYYFLIHKPQKQQAQKHEQLINSLKRGDRILTQAGFYATVHAVKGKVLDVKLAENVVIQINKSAVAQMVSGDPSREDEPTPALKS